MSEDPSAAPSAAPSLIASALVRWPMRFMGLMMLAGVAINMANVVGRYLFSAPIFWAEEILVYMMIWAVFIGLPAIMIENAHLRMDLFYAMMNARARCLVDGLATLVSLACGVFGVYYSWQVVTLLATNRQTSVAAGAPMALVHASMLAGFALMLLAVAIGPFVSRAKRPEDSGQ